jgi:diguanylate cyclase (GGDEF)-like protein/PAS domain S-box-containing protein
MTNSDGPDFQFLTENSADMICRVGMDRVMRYASPACLALVGWRPEELVGQGPEALILPEDIPVLVKARGRALASGVEDVTGKVEVRARKKDGSIIWLESNARLIRDPATGEPVEIVLVMRDINERKLLEEKLLALSMTDGLTGLANRRAFDEVLEKEWRRTLREGLQISLLMLDLDHFKEFNDRYGHQFGDDCLRAVASTARDVACRATDTVARYGGEEIALILPCTDTADAGLLAETLRLAIAALRIPHAGNPEGGGMVTASIGVATALARHGGTMRMPESLLLAADNALYQAKREGRNRVGTTMLMAPQDL